MQINRTIGRKEKERLLRRASIFDELSDKEIADVASHSDLYQFDRHELLYEPGSTAAELFIIYSGSVSISRSSDSGPAEQLARFVAGESFGELDLLSEDPRNEEARAQKPSLLLIFPRRGEAFGEIIAANPRIYAQVLQKLVSAVAGKLRLANSLLKQNSLWVRELQSQVYTDPLTGLHNRAYLEENLAQFFGREPCGLLMLKPDNFKQINDSFGHEAGDAAIREIGETLTAGLRPGEELVRFMGNEYALILPGVSLAETLSRAEELQQIMMKIKYEKSIGKNDIVVTVSVGIVAYPDNGTEADDLIARAHALALRGRTIGGSRLLQAED